MKIEAGKSYRTRDNGKFTVYTTTARSNRPIHGVYHSENGDLMYSLLGGGIYASPNINHDMDLIAPWPDEPTMDLSALPRWATHVTNGRWLPGWCWRTHDNGLSGGIPTEYAPTQTVPVGSRYRIDREANRLVLDEGGGK